MPSTTSRAPHCGSITAVRHCVGKIKIHGSALSWLYDEVIKAFKGTVRKEIQTQIVTIVQAAPRRPPSPDIHARLQPSSTPFLLSAL